MEELTSGRTCESDVTKLYELRSGFRSAKNPVFVKKSDLSGKTGFRSIYGYPKEILEIGLRRHNLPLYSDTLFLDVDNNQPATDRIQQWLLDNKVKFKLYWTGNRGHHFEIPIEPMEGQHVPHLQKTFVQKTFPGADLSLYKSTGIIRLEGTYHTKNPGGKKSLVQEHGGNILTISPSLIPDYILPSLGGVNEEAEEILDHMLCRIIEEGCRNKTLFVMASLCKEIGIDYENCYDLLYEYNTYFVNPPLDVHEIKTIIRSSFT